MAVGSKISGHGSGRDLVAGDIAIGVGFGADATVADEVSIRAGSNRSRGSITVMGDGANPAQATATVEITFPEPFDSIPVAFVSRDVEDETSGPGATESWYVAEVTTTTLTVQADTLPVDTEDVGFSYLVVE